MRWHWAPRSCQVPPPVASGGYGATVTGVAVTPGSLLAFSANKRAEHSASPLFTCGVSRIFPHCRPGAWDRHLLSGVKTEPRRLDGEAGATLGWVQRGTGALTAQPLARAQPLCWEAERPLYERGKAEAGQARGQRCCSRSWKGIAGSSPAPLQPLILPPRENTNCLGAGQGQGGWQTAAGTFDPSLGKHGRGLG